MSILTVVVCIYLGVNLGLVLGLLVPMLVAYLMALAGTVGDSGMGFAAVLTMPVFAFYGGCFGYKLSRAIINQNLGWQYFTTHEGLIFGLPFVVFGVIAALAVVYFIKTM